MEVTAESNGQFVAFRRLVFSLSKQLSGDDARAIVFIHFCEQQDSLNSSTPLDILCKLESKGIATSSNPDKLLELMRDLKRHDLASEVKDFIKKKKSKNGDKKSSTLGRKQKLVVTELDEEDDLILRSTLEAALVQATVLLQHMEVIQTAISGSRVKKDQVKEIVTEAAQTSEALAERLRRAEVRVHQQDQDQRSSSSSVSEGGDVVEHRDGAGEGVMGYVNTGRTDRFSKLMSSSVPNNLSHLYDGRIPGRPATAESLPRDTREDRKGEGSADDSDEDDYEPMNPGISAAEIEAWEERRKSVSHNELSSRRGYSKAEGGTASSPVHYTRVIVPPSEQRQNAKPVLAKFSGGRSQITYAPALYSKQGCGEPKPSNLLAIPEAIRTVGRHARSLYVDTPSSSSSSSQQQQLGSDDNYTTLHLGPGQRGGSNHYYKPLDRNYAPPIDEYMSVHHTD